MGKKKEKLSLTEETEWEDYFLKEAKKVLHIKSAIETTEKEIDKQFISFTALLMKKLKQLKGHKKNSESLMPSEFLFIVGFG